MASKIDVQGVSLPLWAQKLREQYLAGIASQFLLHSNINDLLPYQGEYVTLREFLSLLLGKKELLIFYNRSEGITFAKPEMKEIFMRALNVAFGPLNPYQTSLPHEPSKVLPLLEIVFTFHSCGIVIDYAETIVPAGEISYMSSEDRSNLVTLRRWASSPQLLSADSVVILVTENVSEIHPSLRNATSRMNILEIPFPSQEERLDFIQWMTKRSQVELEMSPEILSHITAGLTRVHISDIFRQVSRKGEKISFDLVRERKKLIIENECANLVEFVEPEHGFEVVGGLEPIKEILSKTAKAIRAGKTRWVPMGILFDGPPGTGKTLMAKAAATYTDSTFVAASGSEFVEMYVGVGASRVRDVFRRARASAKREGKDSAIVFIDEIDVIGGRRGGQSHQEYDQTLNQLLTEMDGMQTTHSPLILVIAATNRVDILDPALLRPGRFDRLIQVDLPDRVGRLHILNIQTKNKPLAAGVDLSHVAKETFGFSGAQLESLANEAAILAMREERVEIEQQHFREAVDKVPLGEKTGKAPSADELRRVAIHELGHAITSELMRPNTVAHIVIVPRGNALGFVRQVPEQDHYLHTKEQLDEQIVVALGGAIAEELLFGNRSTGAQNDFEQASQLARTQIICGLSSIGIVDRDNLQQIVLDEEIRRILAAVESRTREVLQPYTETIRSLSETLVQEENMSGDDFRARLSETNRLVAIIPSLTQESGISAAHL